MTKRIRAVIFETETRAFPTVEYALSLYKKTAKTREERGRNSMSGCEWSFFQMPGILRGFAELKNSNHP
ncbi:MAG: hypothetical protein HFI15_06580 [Lachnospiraceae bacterium]|nr:hypothetical protein [Lachnospiraceae bacterium]